MKGDKMMRIALTQMDIVWEDREENKKQCRRMTKEAAAAGAEIIVFPEMTLTGFTMTPELFAEDADCNKTDLFFQDLSNEYHIAIVYGCIEKRQDCFYNMLIMVNGCRHTLKYAKIHPFSMGGENEHYGCGEEIVFRSFHDTQIGGFICYDLRFPEIFQISSKSNELIFVIANWPEVRLDHWMTLLKARAIENQCFMVGVNRKGIDQQLHYAPSSVVFDPYGNCITETGSDKEILYADLDIGIVTKYREEFPLKQDRREEFYKRYL